MNRIFYNRTSIIGFIILLSLSLNLPAQESIPWWKHWDKQSDPLGLWILDPVVIHEEDIYKMWFSVLGSPNSIGYAESDDGLTWSDGLMVIPGGGPGDWDQNKDPGTVLRINDTLRMWYSGFQNSSNDASYGYGWSLDGITWSLRLIPVLEKESGCWDQWGLSSTPRVYYDGFSYHMWYSAVTHLFPVTRLAIGYATSSNGINWAKDLINSPVITTGPEGSFYDTKVTASLVVNYRDTLHMLFAGFNGDGYVPICYHQNFGYAYSPDGINWTVSSDTAMKVGAPGAWDAANVWSPSILFHEGYFKMWYTGASTSFIGIGYSDEPVHCFPDGVTFSSQGEIDDFHLNNPDCRVIKGDVIISGVDITNLDGIHVLTYINGSLKIENNNLLTSLSGLENIDPASIEELWITNNPNLSFCAVKSICDYLVTPTGSITIFNNAQGCENPEEVIDICNTLTSVNEISSIKKFTISPNPFSGTVTLEFTINKKGLTTIDLYPASGIRHQQLFKETKLPGTYNLDVDLSDLQPGIYLIRLMTGDDLRVVKAVKL